MSYGLHTAKKYQIQYASTGIWGYESEEAMTRIFNAFNIHTCGDEYSPQYEIERDELIRLRDMIANRTEDFTQNEATLNEEIAKMELSIDEFIEALNELITTSDQTNDYVLLHWF